MKNQLKILIPSITFELPSGGEVTLNPFRFQDFSQVIAIVQKYLNLYINIVENDDIDDSVANAKIIGVLFERVEDQYILLEDISTLIKLASGKSQEEINQLSYDQVVSIFAEIVEMNGDFFARNMKKLKGDNQKQEENLKTGELESAA